MGFKLTKQNRGFTITEVLIVLAIAGLIMSIVFYAVPQLQRNQRDTNRKNLAGRLLGSIETYASNNQGIYPFAGASGTPTTWTDCSQAVTGSPSYTCNDWYSSSLAGSKVNLADPTSGTDVHVYYSNISTNPTTGTITPGDIYVGVGDICTAATLAAGQATGSASSKQFALLTALEKSGSWNCIDNR